MRIDLTVVGPQSPDYTRDVASAAAEAVRVLNHTTRHGGLGEPGDVYDVLADLAALADGLPQTLRQLAGWLAAQAAAGHIGQDPDGRYRDAAEATAALERHLAAAREVARALSGHLAAGQAATAALTRPAK